MFSIDTRKIWRTQIVGLYAAAILVVVQHFLTCRLRYGTILFPQLAPYIPWYLIAVIGAAGIAFGLWAYRQLLVWGIGAVVIAVPGFWLGSYWTQAVAPKYDFFRHMISGAFSAALAVMAIRGYLLDQEFGRQQLNVKDKHHFDRPKRKYKPIDRPPAT